MHPATQNERDEDKYRRDEEVERKTEKNRRK